jgi:hypothetical protein
MGTRLENYTDNPDSDARSLDNASMLADTRHSIVELHKLVKTVAAPALKSTMPEPEGALKRLLDEADDSAGTASESMHTG